MALGADGIIRSHPGGDFRTVGDTSPYLFVPVLFTLASGLFFRMSSSGTGPRPP